MTHRANTSPRWTPAEDDVLTTAKRDRKSTVEILNLLPGRSAQSIDNRVATLRAAGVDLGQSRRGRKVLSDQSVDRDFEHFRIRTAASSAALLAAIVKLTSTGGAHVR